MIHAIVKYGMSYAETEPMAFTSKAHLVRHVKEPWNYPAFDETAPGVFVQQDRHPRSYWPCHGDWPTHSIVAYTHGFSETELLMVGPKGGLYWW